MQKQLCFHDHNWASHIWGSSNLLWSILTCSTQDSLKAKFVFIDKNVSLNSDFVLRQEQLITFTIHVHTITTMQLILVIVIFFSRQHWNSFREGSLLYSWKCGEFYCLRCHKRHSGVNPHCPSCVANTGCFSKRLALLVFCCVCSLLKYSW